MKPSEQASKFSGLTPSQIHCLICRTSMYIYSILLCKKYEIKYIAEGSRLSQEFVIELPGMSKERYPALVKRAGIDLLVPVYELDSDWDRDNELLKYNFLCKTLEAKCIIGVPVHGSVDESVIEGVHLYYDEVILKHILDYNLLNLENFETDKNYDELQ